MALKDSDIKLVIDFVKKEPRTVQDISVLIKRSWVTTDSYLREIRERTGLIEIKAFRKGTPAALKVVFYSQPESLASDDLKEFLYGQIKGGRGKNDFDFMDVFQYVKPEKKKAFTYEHSEGSTAPGDQLIPLFRRAEHQVHCFSGNLSFVNAVEKNQKLLSVIEEMARRKVRLKILTRINIASVSNIEKLSQLILKYPGLIEVRHCYQPLRGFVIDDSIARFSNEESLAKYKRGELHKDTRIVYEIYDQEWINWLQKAFWNLFRSSIEHNQRLEELKKVF